MTICHTLRTRAHLYNKLDLFSLQNAPRHCTIWDRGLSKLLVRGDNAGIWGYTYSANVTFKSPHKRLLTSCILRNALYVRHMITRVIKRSIGEITYKKCKTHVSQRVGHESVHLSCANNQLSRSRCGGSQSYAAPGGSNHAKQKPFILISWSVWNLIGLNIMRMFMNPLALLLFCPVKWDNGKMWFVK